MPRRPQPAPSGVLERALHRCAASACGADAEKRPGPPLPPTLLTPLVPGTRQYSPHVWIAQAPELASRVVVRGFAGSLVSASTASRIARLAEAVRAQELAGSRGIPVPSQLRFDRGVDWRSLSQFGVAAEHFVEGREPDRARLEECTHVFRLLGRLHRVRSIHWGRIGPEGSARGRADRFADSSGRARVGHFIRRIADVRGVEIDPVTCGVVEGAAVKIARRLVAREPHGPFSLLHGDFSPTNCLIGPDGGVTVIDFGHARFGLAGAEFVDALFTFCHAWPEHAAELAGAYLEEAPTSIGRQLAVGESLFLLLTALRQFAHPKRPDRLMRRRFRDELALPGPLAAASLRQLMDQPPGILSRDDTGRWSDLIHWFSANRAFEGADDQRADT